MNTEEEWVDENENENDAANTEDMPPLSPTEYPDSEDEDDAARLSQYHKESNTWLLFVRVSLLLLPIFPYFSLQCFPILQSASCSAPVALSYFCHSPDCSLITGY